MNYSMQDDQDYIYQIIIKIKYYYSKLLQRYEITNNNLKTLLKYIRMFENWYV